MASIVTTFGSSPPCLAPKFKRRVYSSLTNSTSTSDSDFREVIGGVSSPAKDEERTGTQTLNGRRPLTAQVKNRKKKKEDEFRRECLEPLWDDGYGHENVKDYFKIADDMIRNDDGGPVRWLTPISCGPHLKDSPLLLFLPGSLDGLGIGLILHHKSLGRVFDVWCMHIPVQDRTPFEELVIWVEKTVRSEHDSQPNKPIYLVGDSFGGCLALSIAARNPDIDLVLILANPATSFSRSQLQPVFPLVKVAPDELHVALPYLLSFIMGNPLKMAAVGIKSTVPPSQYYEKIANSLTSLIPYLSSMVDIMPKRTLVWKLKLLETASAYANSRLHAVAAEVLILASGKDSMLPSVDEAWRLFRSLRNCNLRVFKDNGHTLLLEDGVSLLTVIKSTYAYRRSRRHDYVRDFLPFSMSEFKQATAFNGWYQRLAAPVMFSTMKDGTITRGLGGIPEEGPVLVVGYHMLMGLELVPLMEGFLREKKIVLRGLGHPSLFSDFMVTSEKEFSYLNVGLYGAVPVTPNNLFKLLEAKSHVLLYPGGIREALHRKGEEYKLSWPDDPQFVRMAARFGAKIVPFGVIGEDDLVNVVVDSDDVMNIPILGEQLKRYNDERKIESRAAGMRDEVSEPPGHVPLAVPKIPGRVYFLFGNAIETRERKGLLEDKEKAREVYVEIQSEVRRNLMWLMRKRKSDPYRNIIDRALYQSSVDEIPTFDL
ncbi:hypothetical protein M569_00724 [Genlisea aurea]|uniref:Serine aminopeptidase S33 domain-containing protein n=1 Tax=Genlisea aurea TaxID=192259 RepID=S8D2S3_9LAMI|nr:hypothetical protein M569_00724 [Genlisea aurea]